MSVVIVMLIMIIVLVGGLVWFYYTSVPLPDAWARRIEVFGYVLFIVVAIWGFAVKNVAFGQFYDGDWIINEKLHYIFIGITSLHNGGAFDTSQAWNGFLAAESSEYVQEQLRAVDCAEAVLQVLSAACVGIGRLQELKNARKKKTCKAVAELTESVDGDQGGETKN